MSEETVKSVDQTPFERAVNAIYEIVATPSSEDHQKLLKVKAACEEVLKGS